MIQSHRGVLYSWTPQHEVSGARLRKQTQRGEQQPRRHGTVVLIARHTVRSVAEVLMGQSAAPILTAGALRAEVEQPHRKVVHFVALSDKR